MSFQILLWLLGLNALLDDGLAMGDLRGSGVHADEIVLQSHALVGGHLYCPLYLARELVAQAKHPPHFVVLQSALTPLRPLHHHLRNLVFVNDSPDYAYCPAPALLLNH